MALEQNGVRAGAPLGYRQPRRIKIMFELPQTSSVPVVRADFSNDLMWQAICEEILGLTAEGFGADVEFVEEPALGGLGQDAIVARYARSFPHQYRHPVLFVVDQVAVAAPEHPLLVINLNARVDSGPFRALPSQVQGVQNNLSLRNMDYVEFSRSVEVEGDGVFRGF
jgi:hypothetical protein